MGHKQLESSFLVEFHTRPPPEQVIGHTALMSSPEEKLVSSPKEREILELTCRELSDNTSQKSSRGSCFPQLHTMQLPLEAVSGAKNNQELTLSKLPSLRKKCGEGDRTGCLGPLSGCQRNTHPVAREASKPFSAPCVRVDRTSCCHFTTGGQGCCLLTASLF